MVAIQTLVTQQTLNLNLKLTIAYLYDTIYPYLISADIFFLGGEKMSIILTSYNYKKYLFKDIFIRFCDEFINSIMEIGSEFSNLEGFVYWTLDALQNQQASCSIYIEDDKYKKKLKTWK